MKKEENIDDQEGLHIKGEEDLNHLTSSDNNNNPTILKKVFYIRPLLFISIICIALIVTTIIVFESIGANTKIFNAQNTNQPLIESTYNTITLTLAPTITPTKTPTKTPSPTKTLKPANPTPTPYISIYTTPSDIERSIADITFNFEDLRKSDYKPYNENEKVTFSPRTYSPNTLIVRLKHNKNNFEDENLLKSNNMKIKSISYLYYTVIFITIPENGVEGFINSANTLLADQNTFKVNLIFYAPPPAFQN